MPVIGWLRKLAPPVRLSRSSNKPPDSHSREESVISTQYPQIDDPMPVIEDLNKALSNISPTSVAFWRVHRELQKTCVSRLVLPSSYTLLKNALYILVHPFTSSDSSDVYKGTYKNLQVCVKKLKVDSDGRSEKATKERAAMLCREALMRKQFKHPNIVPFVGAITDLLLLVSKWMPGGDLTTYVNSNSDIPRITLLVDIASGVDYLHTLGVVHGNLKGSNILVDSSGHARITNFSFAQSTVGEVHKAEVQNARWTAPEVLAKKDVPSTRTDVFSFAMVMVEVFTGKVPFNHETSVIVTAAIICGERPPRPADPTFADELWELLRQCWAQDQRRRPRMPEVFTVLNRISRPRPPRIPPTLKGSKRLNISSRSPPLEPSSGSRPTINVPVPLSNIKQQYKDFESLDEELESNEEFESDEGFESSDEDFEPADEEFGPIEEDPEPTNEKDEHSDERLYPRHDNSEPSNDGFHTFPEASASDPEVPISNTRQEPGVLQFEKKMDSTGKSIYCPDPMNMGNKRLSGETLEGDTSGMSGHATGSASQHALVVSPNRALEALSHPKLPPADTSACNMSSDSLPSFLNLGRSIEIPTVVASFGPILDELAPLPNSLPLDSADSEFQGGACQELIDGLDMVLDHMMCDQDRHQVLNILCKTCSRQRVIPKSMHLRKDLAEELVEVDHEGHAAIFQTRHDNRQVAVKTIRVYMNSDFGKCHSRFCREAVAWRHLRHPNILPLLGVDLEEHRLSMISEWMDQGNINDFVKGHEGINHVQLLADAANGLEYMHSLNMVHGDLKGGNILINRGHRACLTDFGLSTIVSAGHRAVANASSTSVVSGASLMSYTAGGSPRWMSPELLDPETFGVDGDRPTKQSDCYALGMVVYEVLSGNPPYWELTTREKVIYAIVAGYRPKKPDSAESLGFTKELWKILQQCWLTDHRARPNVRFILSHLNHATWSWETRRLE